MGSRLGCPPTQRDLPTFASGIKGMHHYAQFLLYLSVKLVSFIEEDGQWGTVLETRE